MVVLLAKDRCPSSNSEASLRVLSAPLTNLDFHGRVAVEHGRHVDRLRAPRRDHLREGVGVPGCEGIATHTTHFQAGQTKARSPAAAGKARAVVSRQRQMEKGSCKGRRGVTGIAGVGQGPTCTISSGSRWSGGQRRVLIVLLQDTKYHRHQAGVGQRPTSPTPPPAMASDHCTTSNWRLLTSMPF